MKVFTLILTLFSFHLVFVAQQPEDNSWMGWNNGIGNTRWLMYHLEKDEVELLKQKWEVVGTLVEKSSNKYSGTYLVPAYMSGYFLHLSDEDYVFVYFFDVEHPCYFSYGKVERRESNITFVKKGESKQSACGIPEVSQQENWVVAYDGQFLIPKNDLRSFIDYQGGFGEFNGLLRKGWDQIPFAISRSSKYQFPPKHILSEEYKSLIKKPLEGEIIAVGKTRIRTSDDDWRSNVKESVTNVSINIGKDSGLKLDQEFILLTEDDGRYESLVVKTVGKRSSKAIVIRHLSDDGKEGFPKWDQTTKDWIQIPFTQLRPGIKITTSPLPKIL